jgi:transcriptional regulator with PAS, ATPase and Fis domain
MQIDPNSWLREFSGSITVCDPDGIIVEMNDQSARTFAADGGRALIGKNLLDCHPEPSRSKLQEMLREQRANVYTTEKHGVKRLIYQAPWYINGEYAGFVELGLEVPFEMPHFVRR